MNLIHVLCFMGILTSTLAIDCMSANQKRCLKKSELGASLAALVIGGDPCFLYNGMRYCFVSTGGSLEQCTCTSECGCTQAQGFSCSNSNVPTNVNCAADQAIYCALGIKNTRCIYCGVNLSSCNKVCSMNLTSDEKNMILTIHNTLRRQVAKGLETKGLNGGQPKAANMFELVWDNELATSAQRWAEQCPQGHDQERAIPGYTWVGQNIADSWSSVASVDKSLSNKISQWYNEVANWPSANVASYSIIGTANPVGHYTLLVWAQTKKIGCGYISYIDVNKPTTQYRQTLICNYATGGNVVGQPVYIATTGVPGSQCPNGVNDGLCKQ